MGILTGMMNGITGSQVMPVPPFLLSLGLERGVFLTAINLSFTFSSLCVLFLLNRFDLLTAGGLGISLAGVIPVAVGIFLGGRLRQHMSEQT